MSTYFADTSALAKRYVSEIGSTWVRGWIDEKAGNTIVISRLTTVELVSALARRQRELTISAADFTKLRGAFIRHADKHYVVINLTSDVLVEARDLVVKHIIRSLDAIQLASALKAERTLGNKVVFVSADIRLLAAVTAEGLAVDDPNAHP